MLSGHEMVDNLWSIMAWESSYIYEYEYMKKGVIDQKGSYADADITFSLFV